MVAEEGCLVGFLRAPKHGNSLLVNSLDIDDLKLVAGVRLDIQPSASRICEPSGDAQYGWNHHGGRESSAPSS